VAQLTEDGRRLQQWRNPAWAGGSRSPSVVVRQGGGGGESATLRHGAAWGLEKKGERACATVGHTGRPVAAHGRQTRAATLLREQERTAGHGDSVRERLTGGPGQQRGPVAAAGCGRE
jgi:hypothetical protein